MNRAFLSTCSGLLMVATTAALSAQQTSLADVAIREKARRAKISETSKVYTNDDLRGSPRLTTGISPVTTPAAAPSDLTTALPSADDDLLDRSDSQEVEPGEDYWRNRIMTARDGRQRAELTGCGLTSPRATTHSSEPRSSKTGLRRSRSWNTPRPTSSDSTRKSATSRKRHAALAFLLGG